MASDEEYILFVCEQIETGFPVRFRKMFGDYMVYVNEKPIILVCDNTCFVKMVPELKDLMADAETGIAYNGAKERYILDIENHELVKQVVEILERITPTKKLKA